MRRYFCSMERAFANIGGNCAFQGHLFLRL
ncbi:hypothetical protein D918_05225 [Trichuris suis]|nr:hypothetical protein D918_05225 [Trichuris suis]